MAVIVGTGSFFLLLSLAVNVIALLVPYWGIFGNTGIGLWGECSCTWLFESDSLPSKGEPEDWFRAAQGLYTIGVGLIFVSLIIVFIITCCMDSGKGGTAMLVAGILLVIAATCIAVAVVVFGIYGAEDWRLSLGSNPYIGWGLWLGVAGVVICVVAAIIHIHQARPRY